MQGPLRASTTGRGAPAVVARHNAIVTVCALPLLAADNTSMTWNGATALRRDGRNGAESNMPPP